MQLGPKVSNITLLLSICLFFNFVCMFCFPGLISAFYVNENNIFSPWRVIPFITFCLFTDELANVFLSILAIFMLDKLIRGTWSKLETLVFILFVNTTSVLFTAFTFGFILPSSHIVICGSAQLVAATFVVSSQFDRERFLLSYGDFGLKSSHGLFSGLILFAILAVLSLVRWSTFLLYLYGFYFAWLYLRFLQHHHQRKCGDHRTSFTMAKFFPGPLEQWISIVNNLVYMFLLRSKLCPGIERQSEIVSTASFAVDIPGLTTDADRHRRIALKALNEHLFTKRDEPTEWPNLEEVTVTSPVTTTVEVPAGLHAVSLSNESSSESASQAEFVVPPSSQQTEPTSDS